MSGLAFILVSFPPALLADNWPAWRGPTGQGLCAETDLPLRWDREHNVKWKVALPAPGNSTPVVWDDRVFLTQATEDGRRRGTLCFDRHSGDLIWKRSVTYEAEEPTHRDNPYCSGSPATDGDRVVVSYGSAGVFCYDLDGQENWRRDLGAFHHIWGNSSSPVLHGDLCYINCGPGPRTFLVALDKRTGTTVWKVDMPGGREGGDSKTWTGSWSTPLLTEEGGREVLLASYPDRLSAHDPLTGGEIWRCEGLGLLVYTSPLAREGVVVSMSGYMGPALAVRAGGSGDVTATRRLWRTPRAPQRVGSGVIHGEHIYIVNDPGVAQCIELETGKVVWESRLGSKSWSSLVVAGDRLYSADRAGNCFVFRAATKFELLAKNELGERIQASIAPSNGELFIRTYEHLWCIARSSKDAAEEAE